MPKDSGSFVIKVGRVFAGRKMASLTDTELKEQIEFWGKGGKKDHVEAAEECLKRKGADWGSKRIRASAYTHFKVNRRNNDRTRAQHIQCTKDEAHLWPSRQEAEAEIAKLEAMTDAAHEEAKMKTFVLELWSEVRGYASSGHKEQAESLAAAVKQFEQMSVQEFIEFKKSLTDKDA